MSGAAKLKKTEIAYHVRLVHFYWYKTVGFFWTGLFSVVVRRELPTGRAM